MSGRSPRLVAPVGATDTHIHIYHAEVPPAAGGPALPGDFRESQYLEMRGRLGLERVVVVQPNAYQDDNSLTLAAIRALGPGAKGVGVVKPGVPDAEIERLTRGGIVAQRIFQLPWGTVGFERMH
ncbi:MAG: amidohydrolase, partial [Candidatus Parcubacteria bacterium]|nr:amidohydrolase [Burkholderiales bacterium]